MQSNFRRAFSTVAAVLVVALLVACGSSSSSTSGSSTSGSSGSGSKPGKGKPPITIGDKNFTEEYTLGDMYAQALQAKGFTVKLKPNIGSSELTDKSLTSHQIDMYPEYTGVILSVIKGQTRVPPTAHATYVEAKKFEESRGFTLLNPTPFEDRDVTATLVPFAKKHGLKSMNDLHKLKSFTNGGPPENKTRYEGIVGMHKAYHLYNVVFVPLAIGLQYSALDSGKVDTANVFTTDGQLQSGHYTLLTDPKHIYGFQNVAPVVSPQLLKKEGPAFAQTLNAVDAKLTTHVMQKLNAAVDLNKVSPATVAHDFLKANGLL
jgi:osmoprotectant transport system substrate-binding protein